MTKKYMKRTAAVTVAALCSMAVLTGCGGKKQGQEQEAAAAREERVYPASDTVAKNLEDAGYEVEQFDRFEEAGIDAPRLKAVKGEDYLDVCFDVQSEDDLNTVIEYYIGNYTQYNLASDTDIVYCYSSESAAEDAGLGQE